MRFTPNLIEEIKARLPVSQVVSRKVSLKKAGREFRGLSPFKNEKTPSFFVNDQKGSWFDFASGQNGDIFKFIMLTEGLTFPEAIERLAGEAGVVLPKETDYDKAQDDQRTRLYALVEASAKFFEDKLRAPEGETARRYLAKRGLKMSAVNRFRLGFAPNNRTALKDYLTALGYSADEMIKSGMLIGGEDIKGPPYDRFRGRVMFPITDMKDRVIAFGGRALEADVPAKYLNSPETPLFHKGSILFHAARARPAAHDKGRIIAVEGYMDVVALAEAGFTESVAPLGTALTADQVKLLWRMAPEPILCFDGDSAGRKAAHRAIDTVLPHLKPGSSVRFAFLPDTYDPDDLIRQEGPAAMEAVLTAARSLSDVLWEREWAQGDWSTPERRASLEQTVFKLIRQIEDPSVRGHYADDVRDRLARAFGRAPTSNQVVNFPVPFAANEPPPYEPSYEPAYERDDHQPAHRPEPWQQQPWQAKPRGQDTFKRGKPGNGQNRWLPRGGNGRGSPFGAPMGPQAASSFLKNSPLGSSASGRADMPPREALLLRILLNHPWMLEEHSETIAGIAFTAAPLAHLRDALLVLQTRTIPLDSVAVRTQLTSSGFGTIMSLIDQHATHKSDRFAELDAARDLVEEGWRDVLRLQAREVGLQQPLHDAEKAWSEHQSEEAFDRIVELQQLKSRPVGADDKQE
jgi:DNA primase